MIKKYTTFFLMLVSLPMAAQQWQSVTEDEYLFTENFNQLNNPCDLSLELSSWRVYNDGESKETSGGEVTFSEGKEIESREAYNFGNAINEGSLGFSLINEKLKAVKGKDVTTSWDHALGWCFVNNTQRAINKVFVSYTQEVWATGSTGDNVQFFYQLEKFDNVELSNGISVEALDAPYVKTSNREDDVSSVFYLQNDLAPGDSIIIGFALSGVYDPKSNGNAMNVKKPAISIDDVTVSFFGNIWYLEAGANSMREENWTPYSDLLNGTKERPEVNPLSWGNDVNGNTLFWVKTNEVITDGSVVTIPNSSPMIIDSNVTLEISNSDFQFSGDQDVEIQLYEGAHLIYGGDDEVVDFDLNLIGDVTSVTYNSAKESMEVKQEDYYHLNIGEEAQGVLLPNNVTVSGDFGYYASKDVFTSESTYIEFVGDVDSIHCPNYDGGISSNFVVSSNSTLLIGNGFAHNYGASNFYETFSLGASLSIEGSVHLFDSQSIVLAKNTSNLNVKGELNIDDNAALVAHFDHVISGNGTVNITRKQPVAGKINYWSNPFNDPSIMVGPGGDINGSRFYSYRGGEDDNADFVRLRSPIPMIPGRGYTIIANNETTFSNSAEMLLDETLVYQYSKDEDLDNDSDDNNFYMVGNPYSSSISAFSFIEKNAFQDANILSTIYVFGQLNRQGELDRVADNIAINMAGANELWDAQNPDTIVDGETNDFHIASCQGFFLIDNPDDASNNVTFSNSMRTSENLHFKKAREIDSKMWVSLDNNESYTTTLLAFTSQATNGFDPLYDAPNGIASGMDVWTEAKSNDYEIQGFPSIEEMVGMIPLGVRVNSLGLHHISVAKQLNINQPVYLFDALEKEVVNLMEQDFTFNAEELGEFRNRFFLTFESFEVTDIAKTDVFRNDRANISVRQHELSVSSTFNNPIVKASVVSFDGKVISQHNGGNMENWSVSLPKELTYAIIHYELKDGSSKSQKFNLN